MTPRPLHRWKSFWLGVLVLAFLGWAGVRGKAHEESLIGCIPGHLAVLSNFSGHLGAAYTHWGGGYAWRWESFPGRSLSRYTHPVHVSAWRKYDSPKAGVARAEIFIAHWLVILLFLIPWTAFLIRRGRRLKRLSAAAGEPQP